MAGDRLPEKTDREIGNRVLRLGKKVSVIIPAAGSGVRLKSKVAKPYISLKHKPLLWYCLKVFEQSRKVNDIIVVSEKTNINQACSLVKKFKFKKVKAVVVGGATRSQSVCNGLDALEENTDIVLIHDGARPFIDNELINKCINAAFKYKAVIFAVPCSSTIKKVNRKLEVVSTLDRNVLWQVQTPQGFDCQLIKRAYRNFKKKRTGAFDDASLVEKIGHKVKVIPGINTNIKITTQTDLKLARAILKTRNQKSEIR